MKKLRIGVFGAGRGCTMINILLKHPDAEVVAICDKYRPLLEKAGRTAEENGVKVALFEDFEEFFRYDMDAVVLANYACEHAPYAIRLLRSGRHVLSECLTCASMAQAVQLIEAVEETGKVYAYAENYCYLDLAPDYIPEREIRIFDFFPKAQLERLNEMGAIVVCHIPRPGRLKDPVNLGQIMEIKRQFPRLRFIVAHIGRAYTEGDVGNAFDTLDKAPDLMYDFCANCCEYAITEVLRHAGPKHLMFGTDMPITRMRMHRIAENGTYINLVPPGLYGDPSLDPHLREVSVEEAGKITFFAYEELLAFKRAATALGLGKEDVEDVMYNNAKRLIEGAERDIYGEPERV